ncbi:hypothetical protein L2E82_31286 [Cichorium intybus]|uniref:Uncharacterized protein n=1 Tax=Cichorium intybus TaxID=13427 RepID=A0ACB9D2I1_CICIN|nr:hypothetical protein L2E82_31286 [Cichorium intybus]
MVYGEDSKLVAFGEKWAAAVSSQLFESGPTIQMHRTSNWVSSDFAFQLSRIWYYGFQNRTVARVANEDNLFSDDSDVFRIGNDGSLIVTDGNGRVYWSSNSPSVASNLTAMLFDNGNLSACVRKTRLNCNSNGSTSDGFFRRTGIKLSDFADGLAVGSSGDCENACLMNCSCNAYAYVSGIGCLIWGDNLVDVEQFEQSGETLFIRHADANLGWFYFSFYPFVNSGFITGESLFR